MVIRFYEDTSCIKEFADVDRVYYQDVGRTDIRCSVKGVLCWKTFRERKDYDYFIVSDD